MVVSLLDQAAFWHPQVCKRGNRCPFVRFGRCHFWHPERDCVQQAAETAETTSVVSIAGTTSTPHVSAERTAHLDKVFSRLGSLMSTLQDFWNEALAAGIDGKIKLQAAELQEIEDARQKAWINECAALTDKLAHVQEPEQLEEMSVCHVKEDAWQESSSEAGEHGFEGKHRDQAVEQDIEAKHSMQGQGAARQEACKPQTGSETDLEYGRFGDYIKQLDERWAKLQDRLTAHVEAEIESRAAQWRGFIVERQKVLDDDRASMV